MEQYPLTKQLYTSPLLEQNQEKYGIEGCICCFTPLTDEHKNYVSREGHYVHVITNIENKLVAVNPTIVNEDNCLELTGEPSNGYMPVCAGCAKEMEGYVFKLKEEDINWKKDNNEI